MELRFLRRAIALVAALTFAGAPCKLTLTVPAATNADGTSITGTYRA